MSYNPAVERRRPGVVTAAAYLMIMIAVLEVVNLVINLVTLNKVLDATRQAYAALPNVDTVVNAARIAQIAGVVVGLLLAAGFVILALLDLRGRNAARIVTWVVAGLGVLCFGCGAVGAAGGGLLTGMQRGNVNGVDVQQATKQINAAIPAWVRPTGTTILVINLLAVIAVIVLLSLPAANEFFRSGAAAAEPPIPALPYPPVPGAEPAYPPVPGAEPAYPPVPGSEPGYPPVPGSQPGHPPAPGSAPGTPPQPGPGPEQTPPA